MMALSPLVVSLGDERAAGESNSPATASKRYHRPKKWGGVHFLRHKEMGRRTFFAAKWAVWGAAIGMRTLLGLFYLAFEGLGAPLVILFIESCLWMNGSELKRRAQRVQFTGARVQRRTPTCREEDDAAPEEPCSMC